ncbi:MAG: hypothetical protein Alis3KO_41310 [Aliiglaciecola sp.]
MNREIEHYRKCLEDLHSLLSKNNEGRWARYFANSISLLNDGKPHKSMLHCLKAYGGASSFNDELYFTGATFEVAGRGYELREELWQHCKNNYRVLKRWIEW